MDALTAALRVLTERHDALRLSLDLNSQPPTAMLVEQSPFDIEWLCPPAEVLPETLVRSELIRWLLDVDWRREVPPLARASLVPLGPEEHILSLTLDGLISDDWGFRVFTRDLGEAYGRAIQDAADHQDGPRPLQFSTWVQRQRAALTADTRRARAAFWRQMLGPASEILHEGVDQLYSTSTTDTRHVTLLRQLDPRLATGLRERARASKMTLFVVLAGCLAHSLRAMTGATEFCVATNTANRALPGSLDMLGHCANTVWLPISMSRNKPMDDEFRRIQITLAEVLEHSDLPTLLLLNMVWPGLFDHPDDAQNLFFNFLRADGGHLSLTGLDVWETPLNVAKPIQGLKIWAIDTPPTITIRARFGPRFAQTTVEAVLDALMATIREVVAGER